MIVFNIVRLIMELTHRIFFRHIFAHIRSEAQVSSGRIWNTRKSCYYACQQRYRFTHDCQTRNYYHRQWNHSFRFVYSYNEGLVCVVGGYLAFPGFSGVRCITNEFLYAHCEFHCAVHATLTVVKDDTKSYLFLQFAALYARGVPLLVAIRIDQDRSGSIRTFWNIKV
jgi:hypothetical protein